MALSRRAVEELLEFARSRGRESAILRDAAHRAELDVSPRRAYLGQRLTVRWAADAVAMPVALRIGDDAPWMLVDPAGELHIDMPARSHAVSMKVGRFLVHRVVVQLQVIPLDWHLLPAQRQTVPFGGCATWGYLAAGAEAVALREEGQPWQPFPLAGRIAIANVFTPRRLELRIRAPQRVIEETLLAIPQPPQAPVWDRLLAQTCAEAPDALHAVSKLSAAR
jgi:hypothetical protein